MSLPNLHPAVVHFPIALWIAAIVFDLVCLVLKRYRWIDFAAAALYALGAAGAGAACLAGESAEDSLQDLPASLETFVENHSDWGWRTLYLFGLVAVLRLAITWLNRREAKQRLAGARWLVLLAALSGAWSLAQTADLGGALVYQHGVAVSAVNTEATAPADPPSSTPPELRSPAPGSAAPPGGLVRGAGGSLSWTPGPEDTAGTGGLFTPAAGSDPSAIVAEAVARPGGSGAAAGMTLRVSGRGLLLLPDRFGDVRVEAALDLTGFEGTAGLAHHAGDLDDYSVFQVTNKGAVSLVRLERGTIHRLDRATVPPPSQPLKLAVSSAGQHVKGMVNGRVIAHGHARPLPQGSVGLLLDGTGSVRVLSIRIEPLKIEKR